MLNKTSKILLLIIFGALVVRLIGIDHGFPFIFHSDEPAVVRSATGIRFNPNPGHFDWPHLHFYLNFAIHWLFARFRGLIQVLGLRQAVEPLVPIIWRDPLVFYLLSRVFDAFLGALTIIPVFLAAKNLFNKKIGLLSAAVFAILPFHVHVSHFALIDVPTAFWVAWAFYFSTKIYKTDNIYNYLLSGLFIGFAASTKYNGGLFAITVPIAHIFRVLGSDREKLVSLKGLYLLVYSGLACFAGFVLGTPYSVMDFDTFIRNDSPVGAMWQFGNVGKVRFIEHIQQFAGALTYEFFMDFGGFILLYLGLLIYSLRSKKANVWLVLLPSIIVFYYTSGFAKMRAHYFISLYPFVAIASGYVLYYVFNKLKDKWQKVLLAVLVFGFGLYLSGNLVTTLARKDTRVELYEWMSVNIKDEDFLVYTTSSFLPVVEKFSDNETDKGYEQNEVIGKSGYIIADTGKEEFEEDVYDGKFKKTYSISAHDKRGPYIHIYEF